jgi:hypothetical protein
MVVQSRGYRPVEVLLHVAGPGTCPYPLDSLLVCEQHLCRERIASVVDDVQPCNEIA